MATSWKSTQFWFSLAIAALAQWGLVAGHLSAEVWGWAIGGSTVLFGGRKVVEHFFTARANGKGEPKP